MKIAQSADILSMDGDIMNKEWSELNKQLQLQLKKSSTFEQGIDTLLVLREKLMEQIQSFRKELRYEDFSACPFRNAKGYHSKTVAYSLFHIFRIEDITVNSLIKKEEQIFLAGGWAERMNSAIITTGNELAGEELTAFSAALDIDALYEYIEAVNESTEAFLRKLSFDEIKRKPADADREYLRSLGTVSEDESACWLIDYWCGKDIRGLIQMPLSRHWIMHVEAALRIRDRLCR